MNKYRVVWHYGLFAVLTDELIIADKIMEADNIKSVKYLDVLTDEERKKYSSSINYCLRVLNCDSKEKIDIDYGSYSKFITVTKIE